MRFLPSILAVFLASAGTSQAEPVYEVKVLKNLAYVEGAEKDEEGFHTLDLYLPVGLRDFPTVIFVHGGGWSRKPGDPPTRGRHGPHNAGFARQGIAVASISYRLTPAVMHPEHVKDVALAVGWVKNQVVQHGGRADNLFVTGHSAGGHLAALLGTDPQWLAAVGMTPSDLRGVIPVSGVFDLQGEKAGKSVKVFGEDESKRLAASPLQHVKPGLPPFLLLYAEKEGAIYANQSAAFHKALGEAGVSSQRLMIAERDHSSIITRYVTEGDPAGEAAVKFIREHSPKHRSP